ncbi:cryptochrome/deoxyribodipyrimidine photo-lyase family protein [Neolewinella antarctica]|uniref:Deoxyribodipyrimidine photo-lyase n=1 Tax=Neolewinella antarctica TaxID=442734 RepID=A0ABX0X7R7_9BACT|nr:FAD-binding domain-containing protein [Neolewinella antarctica]NJC25276.1 deoxyribodipyrimidine photo-lyase [Neolewinella antarctica]
MSTHAIYWLKRDFRLADNPALTAALEQFDSVTPVFILEPSALSAPETSFLHVHAQCDAFNGLTLHLRQRTKSEDQILGLMHEEVVVALEKLYRAKPFAALISHFETGVNRTFARDKAAKKWCNHTGVAWQEHRQTGVFRGPVDRDVRHKDWEAFYKADRLPIPTALHLLKIPDEYTEILQLPKSEQRTYAPATELASDKWMTDPALLGRMHAGPLLPEHFGHVLSAEQLRYVQPVSEQAAEITLTSFHQQRALDYSKGMSSPNTAFYRCSRLSVHLAWGTISGRCAYQRTQTYYDALKESDLENAGTWRKNLRSFLSRLHWRDHFTQRLETEVAMEHRPLNPNFHKLKLEDSDELYRAWITGTTGYPMVDACIRCMAVTGYINFRMRAMLTSTAAHMFHLDFRSIDKPMARLYTDYEPGIHLAQLQMQAGMVGINTLRTYSPDKQFLDHDPEAAFVHRWVPELRPYTAAEISKRDLTQGLGDYPPAVVERMERIRAYKKIIGDLKFQPGGREITQAVFDKHGSRRGPRRKKKTPPKKKNTTAKD